MPKPIRTPYHSWRIGRLPDGCRSCVKGAKLVLFATGVCGMRCWYCPISERKNGRDVVVANEWWVKKDSEILQEARLIGAEGAGITGGDPLCRLDRTIRYIRLLKKAFGKKFHIHLYAPTTHTTANALARLHKAGLDEIRFHPWFLEGKPRLEPIAEALRYDWDVGCEIPVIPGRYRETVEVIKSVDNVGVKFLNLNQFEVSETNAKAMQERGYEAESDESFAVKGSGRMAIKLLEYCAKNTKIRVHYCTVTLKDRVQLRNRLKRRAKNVAEEYDIVTDEGLLIRGAVYLKETVPSFGYHDAINGLKGQKRLKLRRKLDLARRRLKKDYGVGSPLMEVDDKRLRILTGAWIVEELAQEIKDMGLKPAVVEEYPTWDALITDFKAL
ncbi:MAG: radical SAM protein [Candidatus Altiarchaeota archaeon]